MTSSARRRRAAVLLSLALASGGLAASEVDNRLEQVEARVGPLVPAVVARTDLRSGAVLRRADGARLLAVRQVPQRFSPPDALPSPERAFGLHTVRRVPAGAYLTLSDVVGERRPTGAIAGLRRGERAVEVGVVGGAGLVAAAGGGGVRVDVLVTTEPRSRPGRTFVALENVELLAARTGAPASGGSGRAGGSDQTADTVATLRVSLRQAVYLTAAESFARELRLLQRPPRDIGRVGSADIGAGEL